MTYESYRAEFDGADSGEQGRARNGHNVGSGFDCVVRRSQRRGEYVALITEVSSRLTGMTFGFLEPDTQEEMQRLAVSIASCPEEIIWDEA